MALKKIKNIIMTAVFSAFFTATCVSCILKPSAEFSDSERRALAKFPEFSLQTVFSGEFMSEFETYSQDQFPMRERLRTVKALFSTGILNKADNNKFFYAENHLSKIDEEENDYMTNYAADLFAKIINQNMTDKNARIYFSIVPDKNFFLAERNGYPSLDYHGFVERMRNKTEYMSYIDITKLLSLDDYYRTDSHWKQENITDVAEYIAKEMGTDVGAEYNTNVLENPFYGVYAAQSAIPVKPDTIRYLTNETIDNCVVKYYDSLNAKEGDMYDMKKAYGKDPYEMFLSGSAPVVTIDNPASNNDRHLVMLRDSFSSSLAPLLIEGYNKITLLDIRYIQSSVIGNFADFENCDVLFIYSSALLNNSTAMK